TSRQRCGLDSVGNGPRHEINVRVFFDLVQDRQGGGDALATLPVTAHFAQEPRLGRRPLDSDRVGIPIELNTVNRGPGSYFLGGPDAAPDPQTEQEGLNIQGQSMARGGVVGRYDCALPVPTNGDRAVRGPQVPKEQAQLSLR